MVQLLLAALFVIAGPAHAEPRLTGAGEQVLRNAVDTGGGLATAPTLVLDGAAGESGVGSLTGAGYGMTAGLPAFIAQPGSVASLVAVSKTTGTLELAWTAPGRDGAVGGVTGGAWRIDYSSDPLHVFDPTLFQTQIATTCNPGDPQDIVLSGLLPNTTYYARVYLADQATVVSETSKQDDDSTLADPPVAPALSGVFITSVTITWNLPARGDEGYELDASSTDFGALFPGGTIVSSRTANGVSVTLTVQGLTPATTYFFKLGSLDWQSDLDFTSILSTCTLPGAAVPSVLNLAVNADNFGRSVTLTWTNPSFKNPAGVTVLVSSTPITEMQLTDFKAYPVGTTFPDGAIVASSVPTPGAQFGESGLQLNTTSYFALFERDILDQYSFAVSTYVVLNLPPMAPAALQGQTSVDGSSITIKWSGVVSALDGTLFPSPFSPAPWDLDRYEVYRATGVVNAGWTLIASTGAAATSWTGVVPSTGAVYYYKIVSRNGYRGSAWTDEAMVVDTLGNLYAVDADGVSRLQFPVQDAALLQPGANPYGLPVLVRAVDRPQDLGGRIVKSVAFQPVLSPSDKSVALDAPDASLSVVLHYQTAAGQVVPSGVGPMGAPITPAINAVDAPDNLGAYYAGGASAAKVFGRVDPITQTVSVESALTGDYQIRSLLRDQAFSFDISGISNKFITPNGDGLNDTVVFTFDNPKDSAFGGKIYDVKGAFVADMVPGPVGGSSLMWDGKAEGRVVPRGVYIYQIKAEGKTFNGTVVVIR